MITHYYGDDRHKDIYNANDFYKFSGFIFVFKEFTQDNKCERYEWDKSLAVDVHSGIYGVVDYRKYSTAQQQYRKELILFLATADNEKCSENSNRGYTN